MQCSFYTLGSTRETYTNRQVPVLPYSWRPATTDFRSLLSAQLLQVVGQGTAAPLLCPLFPLWSLDSPSSDYAHPPFQGISCCFRTPLPPPKVVLGQETRLPTVDTYFLRSTNPKRRFLPRTWSPAPRSRTGAPCGSGAR